MHNLLKEEFSYMSLEVGKIVSGKVSGITNFGAFVSLGEGKTGLVHISEVAKTFVKDINEHLKEGQEVTVKVISMDPGGKISLSIRKAMPDEPPKAKSARPMDIDWSKSRSEDLSFEDKMLRFKQDSDDRMKDIKRSMESKRGGYKRGNSGAY